MTIIIKKDPPPVGTRQWDWQAHVDGHEERYGSGLGPTPTEALADLLGAIEIIDGE